MVMRARYEAGRDRRQVISSVGRDGFQLLHQPRRHNVAGIRGENLFKAEECSGLWLCSALPNHELLDENNRRMGRVHGPGRTGLRTDKPFTLFEPSGSCV